jgi:3-keto-disaccharide hydrolase
MYKKIILVTAACCMAIFISFDGYSQSNHAKETDSWHALFNGKNLQGWHTYLHDGPTASWKVKDGAIMFDANSKAPGGDLVTDGEYQNFDLKLEWKISKGGNSGVIFLVHEDPKYSDTYLTGPEMQVLDNKYADDNKKDSHLAGSLYDLIPADPKAVHPYDEWNKIEIRLDHGHLTLWMNGQKVVETQMWTKQWDEMVAHSKFKQWPEFATFHKGHIALQDHGADVWFRDIKIREL